MGLARSLLPSPQEETEQRKTGEPSRRKRPLPRPSTMSGDESAEHETENAQHRPGVEVRKGLGSDRIRIKRRGGDRPNLIRNEHVCQTDRVSIQKPLKLIGRAHGREDRRSSRRRAIGTGEPRPVVVGFPARGTARSLRVLDMRVGAAVLTWLTRVGFLSRMSRVRIPASHPCHQLGGGREGATTEGLPQQSRERQISCDTDPEHDLPPAEPYPIKLIRPEPVQKLADPGKIPGQTVAAEGVEKDETQLFRPLCDPGRARDRRRQGPGRRCGRRIRSCCSWRRRPAVRGPRWGRSPGRTRGRDRRG